VAACGQLKEVDCEMRKRIWVVFCVVALAGSMLAGCSRTQQGGAIGGTVGAITGGIWAANAGELSTAEGALVGLAAGGLVGALVGDQLDQMNKRDLENQVKNLKNERDSLNAKIKELTDLQSKLEDRIKEQDKEIADLRAKLAEMARVCAEGEKIIVTLLAETHYRSGKAELTDEGKKEIDRVVQIVREKYPDREICVRGHTDTDPIKYSGWKSNWELGSARALNVLHYLMDKHGIKGEKISASTFSAYRPVGDNKTPEGKRQNRRTEIVIMPKKQTTIEKAK